jgi:rsbT co-antagonist protein RsbR
MATARLTDFIDQNESSLLSEWLRLQLTAVQNLKDRIPESELRATSHDFVIGLKQALSSGGSGDITSDHFAGVRESLSNLSRQWAELGFSPSETATFVFSFKEALFHRLRATQSDSGLLMEHIWAATQLLDKLGLYTTEVFQKSREGIINRQQQAMLELSTPVVELWRGILALPLIGTLDSARTQIVMQNLLEALVSKGANLAIIDITGVPTVDTLVAQHLLKTVAAARLMGADCIISGIRPQIAQTIIHLGVDLGEVVTKANLADAFRLALQKKNLGVTKTVA